MHNEQAEADIHTHKRTNKIVITYDTVTCDVHNVCIYRGDNRDNNEEEASQRERKKEKKKWNLE